MKRLRITVDGTPYEVTVEEIETGPGTAPTAAPAPRSASAPPRPAPAAPSVAAAAPSVAAPAQPGAVLSPLAGTTVSVAVAVGQSVVAGEPLMVLEAMKMNTDIRAPQAGTVSAINVAPGATVTEGQVLLVLS
ncbi:biotin/lipoyl-containing protein [Rhodovulum sp. MB263]|uniref:biotin/lipoyl-containing protein n=1 Tax=unclassified Rhodovulum TaxID=2631432 RepID=UPI0009B7E103|nr:biotin/lipoyl-containing protein [Rhodovulum sp. MB263]ARC88431.1 acetyl-CoA carboxylase biotin carboxyl carrier protein subunit [Rhodovulum sp. MB263]